MLKRILNPISKSLSCLILVIVLKRDLTHSTWFFKLTQENWDSSFQRRFRILLAGKKIVMFYGKTACNIDIFLILKAMCEYIRRGQTFKRWAMENAFLAV